jgi:hypothetical protein
LPPILFLNVLKIRNLANPAQCQAVNHHPAFPAKKEQAQPAIAYEYQPSPSLGITEITLISPSLCNSPVDIRCPSCTNAALVLSMAMAQISVSIREAILATNRSVVLFNPDGAPLCDGVVNESNIATIVQIKRALQTIANCGDFVVIKSERGLNTLKHLFNDIPNLSFIADGGYVIEHRGQKTDIVPPPDFKDLDDYAKIVTDFDPRIVAIPGTHYYTIEISENNSRRAKLINFADTFACNRGLRVRKMPDRISIGPERAPALVLQALQVLETKIGSDLMTTYMFASGAINDAPALDYIKTNGGYSLKIEADLVNSCPRYADGVLVGKNDCAYFFSQLSSWVHQRWLDHADRVLAAEGSGIVEAP